MLVQVGSIAFTETKTDWFVLVDKASNCYLLGTPPFQHPMLIEYLKKKTVVEQAMLKIY